ncbi:MAG: amidohydrolase family protein [Saprospiraceae bacterium]|nr:MAG: amidohydrolase [Bacteroidetes bacterium OLB9]MCO6464311.1 amidohydrolase family protein [Saprospiraceae bacterium]MCZ2338289.1 amidohydrolase family protein [Chitinophagales bacterium]
MLKNIIFITAIFISGVVQAQNILIKNGTVLTITDGVKENTDVLILGGKIKQIGANIAVPKDTRVVDAKGLYVMPGIIDAHSHIALDAINEFASPVTAEVSVGDMINPFDVAIYRALAGGVTISHAMHGSANAIGGQCQTIKHRYGVTNPDALKMEGAPRTIKFALGENPMRVHGEGKNIIPNTRMGVEQTFRDAFAEGRLYMQRWEDFRKGITKESPEYNLRLQTMADILRGDILIHCHSYRADEILMLMNVLKDFGVKKICFQHVNEGFKVAPELAAFGATASVFSDWWAYKFEVYYSTAYNAAILTKNGVTTSINSDDPELIRHLYHEASKTQRYGGLTDEQALALITINPAKQLGIDDRVGSITVGKDGDIVLFKHHPLSVYAIPQMTIVDGIVRFDIQKDPDDMRMEVSPTASESSYYQEMYGEEEDSCLQGFSEWLMDSKTK